MGNIFKLDSPVMRFLTLVTNLVCLNMLWLLCCLPVVTAGASTTAMYYLVFQYINKQDDAVIKPFFAAFKDNFRQVTPIWILNLLIGAALAAEVFYLSQGAEGWLITIFAILAFIYIGASSYLYPIMARYDAPTRNSVMNCFALSLRHLPSTILVVCLNMAPVALYFLKTDLFWKTSILWLVGGFALIAYANGRILLSIFKKYEDPVEDVECEAC
ncbi:MAG: YesL family protein [Lachnospiraceae bacterium]|nr:YesL family protein [Lachnospiraceae bacterium]